VRIVSLQVDSRADQVGATAADSSGPQIIRGALAHRHKRPVPVDHRDQTFEAPDVGAEGDVRLVEDGVPEQVVDNRQHRNGGVERHQEGEFADILDQEVDSLAGHQSPRCQRAGEVHRYLVAHAEHAESSDDFLLAGPRMTAAQQGHTMTAGCEPLEDLMNVDLGPARLWVGDVAVVDDYDVETRHRDHFSQKNPRLAPASDRVQGTRETGKLLRLGKPILPMVPFACP